MTLAHAPVPLAVPYDDVVVVVALLLAAAA